MKKSLIAIAVATASLLSAQLAVAQDAPKVRAEVKKEAADAVKAGKIEKGEGAAATAKTTGDKPRADVKKEAAAAEKAGTIEKGPSLASTKASEAKRADVKKEAAAAVKAGEVGKGPDVKK